MSGVTKVINTINQERKLRPNINPKALKQSENVISSVDVGLKNRPTAIQDIDISDMAVWDYPETQWDGLDTNDEWDSYDASQKAMLRVINHNDLFIDNLDFDYFKDADNSNIDWNTTTQEISFASGQVLTTKSVYKDSVQTLLCATLNITYTGALTFEMSADGGSNWETVTNGVVHTFANTGSDLLVRATESSASTAIIKLIKVSYVRG